MLQIFLLTSTAVLVEAGFLHPRSEYTVCHSPECIRVASEFWDSMNKSVDPCEDFYEYACGMWPIRNPIPPDEMMWSNFRKAQKMVQYKVRDILEENIQSDDILPVKQAKTFYQSCMNIEAIEELGIKPLQEILSSNGGWPMTMESEEWDAESFTWQQIDNYYSRMAHISAFYEVELNIPVLPLAVMRSPNKQFNRTKMYNDGSYEKFITEVVLIFAKERQANIDNDQIIADVKNIINLEKELIKISILGFNFIPEKRFQNLYDRGVTHTNTSKINWKKTLENLFAEANVILDDDETICLGSLKYFLELPDIIKATNKRVLANYIHWNFVSQMLPFTNLKMRNLMYELQKVQAGVKEETPRWETCVANVPMLHAISYQFLKKHYQDKMKNDAEEIFSVIQKQIVKLITIPASIFQFPFYFTIEQGTINYGSLGIILGHEVSHGFDSTGIRFDKNGKQVFFSDFFQKYETRARCYVKQFQNFYKNENIDSSSARSITKEKATRSLGENIADSIGLGIVFEAFEEKVKEETEIRLPGFEGMSNEQFYFISFAKLWCESATPKYEELVRNLDTHSQNRYRVISSVQNSEGFAKAFNCPKNSPMNPELKCQVL